MLNDLAVRDWYRKVCVTAMVWLFFAASQLVAAPEDGPVPESESLSVAITPGKPGAPTERVTVTRRAGSGEGTLRMARVGNGGMVLAEEVITLPAADTATLWKSVDREQMRAFIPETEDGEVFDFGEVRLRIESRLPRGVTVAREVSWERPLRHAEASRFDVLKDRLATLAARAKTVRFSYFRVK